MKQFKLLVALVLALTLVLSLSASALAGTITITPPTGLDASATNTYTIYKVFDAVQSNAGISYKLVDGKTTAPAGFSVDNAGNVTYSGSGTNGQLTDADIAAIRAYVTDADKVGTIVTTGSTANTSSDVGTGYFFIDTTTGTVVTIDSTNPNADVNDKNTVPGVDKTITGASSVDDDGKKALAQVGTVVDYQAVITIGKGAKGYIFHDTMENGLKYNNDAAVTGVTAGNDTYTVGQAGNDTFTITFSDDYIKTLTVGSTLTVTYSATVTEDAITRDPLNNTCYVSYGDANSNNRTPDSEADVWAAKITVTKQDGDNKPLANAGFVIQNKTSGAYYKFVAADTADDPTTTGVDESVNHIVWYTLAANETLEAAITAGKVTEYKSDATGAVHAFTGLANGTYTLIESTVPEGYNKAADIDFTIAEHNYTVGNLEQAATVTNNAGQELPSTGGIGTTIFYIAGAVLVLGAAAVILARRKAEQE